MASFPFVGQLGTGASQKAIFATWVFLQYACLAGHYAVMPAVASNLFGPKNMATNYGILYTMMAPGTVFIALLFEFVDFGDNWVIVFVPGAAFVLISKSDLSIVSVYYVSSVSKYVSHRFILEQCSIQFHWF